MKPFNPETKSCVLGASAGVIYGLLLRSADYINSTDSPFIGVMSVSFVFLAPVVMGFLAIYWFRPRTPSLSTAIFFPWVPVILGLMIAMLFKLEGAICVAMYAPAGLIFSSIGGLISRALGAKNSSLNAIIFMAFPLATHVFENQIPNPNQFHEVDSVIAVSASPEKVWNEIKSVRLIEKHELKDSWVHHIGFPRPLDAEIDKEGLGGIRKARFAGDLQFDETVTSWVPEKELSFDIRLGHEVPPTTLDEHVTIGGPYFDVLHGRYQIETVSPTEVRLHLRSRFRLSTRFNWYAAIWTDLIMKQIQSDILGVVKSRVE